MSVALVLVHDGSLDREALGRKVMNLSPFAFLPLADRDPSIQEGLGKYTPYQLPLCGVLADIEAV